MTTTWITGAHGFIGRNLARHLQKHGHTVCGVGHGAWPQEEARNWGLDYWLNGEIEASNLANIAARQGVPDTVFHLAGGSSVGLSMQHPFEDFRRSVDSSARLFEWVRVNTPHTKIVCVSSAAVYGADHSGPIPETAPLSPYSPYGCHKAMMEMLCQSNIRNYGMHIAIARLFSVYGEGLEKQLIWDLCTKLSGNPGVVTLGGTGQELRDWIHISDAVRLLESLTTNQSSPLVVNGGTGAGVPVQEITNLVCASWGQKARIEFSGQQRPGDPNVLVADVSVARKFGFSPSTSLGNGIEQVVSWFKSRMKR
jgi:UDP-glucose 4-epimerase